MASALYGGLNGVLSSNFIGDVESCHSYGHKVGQIEILINVIIVLFRYYKLDTKSNLEFLIHYPMDRLR